MNWVPNPYCSNFTLVFLHQISFGHISIIIVELLFDVYGYDLEVETTNPTNPSKHPHDHHLQEAMYRAQKIQEHGW